MKSFEVVLRVNRTSSNMHICNIVSPIHNVWNVPPSYFPGSQRKIPLFILTYVTFKVFKNLVCDLSFVDLSFPSRPTSITVRGSVFSHRLVMQVDQKSISITTLKVVIEWQQILNCHVSFDLMLMANYTKLSNISTRPVYCPGFTWANYFQLFPKITFLKNILNSIKKSFSELKFGLLQLLSVHMVSAVCTISDS